MCNKVNESSTIVEGLKAEYPEVFSTALGKCTKVTMKLWLKPDQQPVFRSKHPVAYSSYQAVEDELDRLRRLRIIKPVDNSEWAAPIDIFVKPANCMVFSIIDMSDSYLQLEVDEALEDALELYAINTHRGIYKVNRLAPGVKAAPGAFQQVVDAILAGLEHTCGYLDDVIIGVWGYGSLD
ncbi:uncharacterized protein K02A2.6-like [Armigeres subalbatus]|uniref:uncharacterized protein K02A2.6-like n=1 Tax=Armigeres subalbatus TaxID=124917 RepID=UPI002ED1BFDF